MIGESFEVEGATYQIKNKMSFGEYEDLNELSVQISNISKELGDDEEFENLSVEKLRALGPKLEKLAEANQANVQTMANFLEHIVGLKHEDLRKLSLDTAMKVFAKAFSLSTTIKKTSEKISA